MAELAALGAAVGAAASSIPAWVPTAASVAATAASGAMAYGSARQQGAMSKATGEYNAKELERSAAEERARGARAAAERRMKGEQLMSRQRAVAAAGGAGAGDTEGFADIIGDTAQRSDYFSALELAGGESAASGLESKAKFSSVKGAAESDLYNRKATAAAVGAGLDIAATGLKRAPAAGGGDDLIYEEYGDMTNKGWHTTARSASPRRRYG